MSHCQLVCQLVIFDLDSTLIHSILHNMPPHSIAVIKSVRQLNMKTALATLNPMGNAYIALKSYTHLFDSVKSKSWRDYYARYNTSKINMYADICAELNVPPSQTLVLDDLQSNLNVAEQLGMKTLLISPATLVTWMDILLGLSLFDDDPNPITYLNCY